MKRVWNYIATNWQPITISIISVIAVASLYLYKISTLVAGQTSEETATQINSSSLKNIIDNPINAPINTLYNITAKVSSNITAQRLLNVTLALVTIALFYFIVRKLFSRYAAIASTILFATSNSLLVTARSASPQIALLILFTLVSYGYYIKYKNKNDRNWIIGSALLAIALYTPSIIYFVIVALAWQFKNINKIQNKPRKLSLTLCLVLFLLILSPLMIGFVKDPGLVRTYLGLPTQWPSVITLLKNILSIPAGLFLFAPSNPIYRIGKQPLLEAFSAIVFIVGCFNIVSQYKLDRFKLLAGVFLISIVYVALSGNYENSFILLPFVYMIVGRGIMYLMNEWIKVFPNNPLAKWLALLVMSLAILISVNFQLRRYFIAWPNNHEVKAILSISK